MAAPCPQPLMPICLPVQPVRESNGPCGHRAPDWRKRVRYDDFRPRAGSLGLPRAQPRYRADRAVHPRRQWRAARQAAAPRGAAGAVPERPATTEHHARPVHPGRGRRGLRPGLGGGRYRLPRLPAARQPGAPALAADPHRRGAGIDASQRRPAGHAGRSASVAGAGDRAARGRRLPPGDGLRTGVLPARSETRCPGPPAAGAGRRRRSPAADPGLRPARAGTDRAVPA